MTVFFLVLIRSLLSASSASARSDARPACHCLAAVPKVPFLSLLSGSCLSFRVILTCSSVRSWTGRGGASSCSWTEERSDLDAASCCLRHLRAMEETLFLLP